MTYSNKFVMALLVNGVPQTELANNTIVVPFGTEYSLRFRNKHNIRALVKFFIDRENCSGNGYVIPANSVIDIKRHADKDTAFKFVGLNSVEAIDFGKNGDNPDKVKGLIEAKFYLEKPNVYQYKPYEHPVYDQNYWHWNIPNYNYFVGNKIVGCKDVCEEISSRSLESQNVNFAQSATNLQDGCTVEGNSTGQHFTTTYFIPEETYTSLTLFLQGYEPSSAQTILPLEKENEELRKKIAELENKQLKDRLAQLTS